MDESTTACCGSRSARPAAPATSTRSSRFAQEGNDLVEIGRVDKLGVGEQIKSVRWFDDLAIVVTFRQIDPLYAIDLTDPDAAAAAGQLKIPGFSAYLHPLGEHRLLGMGQAAEPATGTSGRAGGAVRRQRPDPPARARRRVATPPDSQAQAGHDPRQFTWLPDRRTALTVISQGYGRRGTRLRLGAHASTTAS